jgi:hypothetical protein
MQLCLPSWPRAAVLEPCWLAMGRLTKWPYSQLWGQAQLPVCYTFLGILMCHVNPVAKLGSVLNPLYVSSSF